MASVFIFLCSFIFFAHAQPQTIQVAPETTIEQFQNWFMESAHSETPVQFEFSNLEKSFDPFAQILGDATITKAQGDIYFLIGDLTNSWSEEEYAAYFPVARWLSLKGFRAVINPAAYIRDVRDAVKAESTSGIIWSSHGSEDGEIFDKADEALPINIFSIGASEHLKHFVLGDCYGDKVAEHYSFPEGAGVHHWTGEITSEIFFTYLKSSKWHEDFQNDLHVKAKKRRKK